MPIHHPYGAKSLDFFGDAVNYGISLAVLSASSYWRATVALVKGITMALFGVVVMGKVIYAYIQGIPPEAITMHYWDHRLISQCGYCIDFICISRW